MKSRTRMIKEQTKPRTVMTMMMGLLSLITPTPLSRDDDVVDESGSPPGGSTELVNTPSLGGAIQKNDWGQLAQRGVPCEKKLSLRAKPKVIELRYRPQRNGREGQNATTIQAGLTI